MTLEELTARCKPGQVLAIWNGRAGTVTARFLGVGRDGRRVRVSRLLSRWPHSRWASAELIEPDQVAMVWPQVHEGTTEGTT